VREVDQLLQLAARVERVSQILATERHPDIDLIAASWASSARQLSQLATRNPDKKLVSSVSSGIRQGIRELPQLLGRIPGVDADRLLRQINDVE